MKNKGLVYIITASTVGTMIEWYDFYIFGSLATIISTQFFPKENAAASFLATLATFAAGLLVRPFGALFFGRLGDLIGRKYTFMVTLLLMGGSTFAIGLIPKYETIGFAAPLIILVLRLLQGLAIGGEYGGAATFVAEHAPVRERGFWTSWIQLSAGFAFAFALGVIILAKSFLTQGDWENWGWRIPFLISIFMVAISVYIRKNMSESPLFAEAKAEGRTSKNPLKESLGNKANLKLVLLALFGLMMGTGVVSWSSNYYAQNFLLKTMNVDYDQTNIAVMIGILLAVPTVVISGWLSDRIGRKFILMFALFLAITCLRPIFGFMYNTINLEVKTENKSVQTTETNRQLLSNSDSLITKTTTFFYTDGTTCKEIKKETIRAGKSIKNEITKTIKMNNHDRWIIILMITLMTIINSIGYGPLAAFLVEMFPLKIRYSSLSLPYHIGYGIFGGMSQVIGTYLIGKAKAAHSPDYYLAGLTYPNIVMTITLVIGLLYLKENYAEKTEIKPGSKNIKTIKRWLGIVWMLLGLAAAYLGVFELGLPKIFSGNQEDLIFGIIMLCVITPVTSIGLFFFGKYALQGEYND